MMQNTISKISLFRQVMGGRLINKVAYKKSLYKNRISNKNISAFFAALKYSNLNAPVKYKFSTSTPPKQQYSKTFLIRISYQNPSDAYYQTYPVRQQFRKQIKQLEQSNKCYIFGGDLFPMEGTIFVVNCDDKDFILDWMKNKNVYAKNKLINQVEIEEVEKISEDKIKKLTYFYQYK